MAGGYQDRHVSIVVVIVGKHRKYFFPDEERWLAMREFLERLG